MNKAHVIMYRTMMCPFCRMAEHLLKGKGVVFEQIDVNGRQDLRQWIASESGQRTVPQIFINGKAIGGFTDLRALDQQGQLDTLLAESPPPDLFLPQ